MWSMKSYRHLNTVERELIFSCLSRGMSYRYIGSVLGRDHRTISREVNRNSQKDVNIGKSHYSPSIASGRSIDRRAFSKLNILEKDQLLRSFVVRKLGKGWSPEQIAGRIKLKAPNCHISYETIYQFIYSKEERDLRLWEFLRRGHTRRQKKYFRRSQRCKHLEIPGRVFIEDRPKEATLRSEFGHFETDDMEGKKTEKEAVSVSVDRKSGLAIFGKLRNQEAETKAQSLVEGFSTFPRSLVKSISFDNGTENFLHQKVGQILRCNTYFCHPYHPYEKGTVENTIGLLRDYLPKKTSVREVTQEDLNTIAWQLNSRPRKRLGFYTPLEAVFNELHTGALEV